MGFLSSRGSFLADPWETAESCTDEPHPYGKSSVLPGEQSEVPPSSSSCPGALGDLSDMLSPGP